MGKVLELKEKNLRIEEFLFGNAVFFVSLNQV